MRSPLRFALCVATLSACDEPAPFEPGEAWDKPDVGSSSDSGSSDGGETDETPQPGEMPRACDPEAWAHGWNRMNDDPAMRATYGWEAHGLRPVAVRWSGIDWRAYYVGQSLAECIIGDWHATCAVGRLGSAVSGPAFTWQPSDAAPLLDLWPTHGWSVKRGDVVTPDRSPSGGWEAWFGVEDINVDARVHHFTSADGRAWEVAESTPVLGPGSHDSWESLAVSDPTVARIGKRWLMWYTGYDAYYYRPQIGVAQLDVEANRWDRLVEGPVFPAGADGRFDAWGVAAPSMLHFDHCHVMFYTARESPEDRGSIGVATSEDGFIWIRGETPVLTASDEPWEDAGVFDPTVWVENGVVRLLYRGFNEVEPGGLGIAELPLLP